ncbi:MAG: glycosyltransferase family 4 protein, partial [Balneolales bacterium]|nr:glycosyltransferase family 4 protein [Balneolales bacterium]
ENLPDFAQRRNFVSIGNFLHDPNTDAVRQLKSTIWPLIRSRLPEAELHIYGAYVNESVLQMHNPREGFIVKGRAEDALETIKNYRVLLAPLRFGAGIKGKLIDAMRTGTPSVTTRIASEGLVTKGNLGSQYEVYSLNSQFGDHESVPEVTPTPIHHSHVENDYVTNKSHNVKPTKPPNEDNGGEFGGLTSNLATRKPSEASGYMTSESQKTTGSISHNSIGVQPLLVANKVSDFVDAAVKLYGGSLWKSHSNAGFKLLSQIRPTGHDLIEIIHAISAGLSSHRTNNFIGNMLSHHTMSSTKYMSRWIEAKNKPKV